MPRWPWLAAAGCVAFFLVLRAWRGGPGQKWWGKAWAAWLAGSLILTYVGRFFVDGFSFRRDQRMEFWANFSFQIRMWLLVLWPAVAGFALDWIENRDFFRLRRWGLVGLALAPFAAGAYSAGQIGGLAVAFVFQAILSAAIRREGLVLRALTTLAFLHPLLFLNASGALPEWTGRLLLIGLFSLGFSPYGARAGVAGLVTGCLLLCVRELVGSAGGWRWQFLFPPAIGAGWWLCRLAFSHDSSASRN